MCTGTGADTAIGVAVLVERHDDLARVQMQRRPAAGAAAALP